MSYQAFYYDASDRLTDSVNLGTNGGTALTARPSLPSRSDTALVTSYTYDDAGWNDSMTDPKDIVTAYTHDALNRLTQQIDDYTDGTPTDSSNQTTDYTYDGDNNLTSQTAVMPSGTPSQTTAYIYGVTTGQGSAINSNDLLYQVQYPDPTYGTASSSQAETFTYDAVGEKTGYTDRNGTTHEYAYDPLGRLISDHLSAVGSGVDGTVRKLTYTYDDAGNLQYANSYNGSNTLLNQVEQIHNGQGQIVSDTQSHSGAVTGSTPSVGYSYGQEDRLEGMTYPDGFVLGFNYYNGFDDRITRLSNIGDWGGGGMQSYQYLGLDTPAQVTDPERDVQLNISFDTFGRISEQNWTDSSSATIDDYQYGYDRNGNVLSIRIDGIPGGSVSEAYQTETMVYDDLNRLSSATWSITITEIISGSTIHFTADQPELDQSWDLDGQGNWNSSTSDGSTIIRTNNAQNQATVTDLGVLGYDSNGNTTTDLAGHTLVYDGWNRLVQVKSGSTVIASYTYDALGRRITETYGSTTTDLYYSTSGQVIEEDQGGDATARYIWSPFYVNQLVARDDQPVSGTLTRRLYAETDANADVTSLTDSSGAVVERFEYEPYGTVSVLSAGFGSTTDSYNWIYNFQGGRTDSVTGFIHFNARDYDPATGRWMQQDPARYINGSNLYQFVESNPVRFVDPSGLEAYGAVMPQLTQGPNQYDRSGIVHIESETGPLLPDPNQRPPGYDPSWPTGNDSRGPYVQDPKTGVKWYPHDEDPRHWPHYDNDKGKRYPEKCDKPRNDKDIPQKRLNPNQSPTNPWPPPAPSPSAPPPPPAPPPSHWWTKIIPYIPDPFPIIIFPLKLLKPPPKYYLPGDDNRA